MTGDELLEFVDRKLFPALRNIDVSTGNRRDCTGFLKEQQLHEKRNQHS